jgi:hypothetical protein
MSNSIVGNNANPTECYTWHETEIGDDEYEDLQGEIVDEENVFGHRAVVPKNSNSTSVTIFYYYLAPTSEWYWDYSYGDPYKPVIPVVFVTDANWNLTQCLNTTFVEHSLTGQSNGWKSFTITLTRKLVEGERIFFGVYSDLLGYTTTGEVEDSNTTTSYFYWTRARRRDYANQITYLSSPEFINQQRNIFCDYEMCIYMQYENEPDGFFYTRSVLGNVGAAGAFAGRSLRAYREEANIAVIISSSVRRLSKIILKTDSVGFIDAIQKLLLLLRSCFSSSEASDNLYRSSDFQKSISSSVENEEEVYRLGESFRSFEDEATIDDLPFASRIFYRTLETVMGLCDWLRGKIREANNVVTLFCPITTELTLRCKI